jgi:quinohemoprotein ethanol dehydrogenase
VYIPASYAPFTYAAEETFRPGSTGYTRGKGEPKELNVTPIGPIPPAGVRSGLQAWDPVNQKLVWRADGGGGIGGGTVTTAGNLVFQVINDGTFRALSADKGEKLFEIQTGRTGMAPPITYEAGGKQYVAFQGGLGRAANIEGPNDAKIVAPPMLFVWEIDGKAPMPAPAVAPVKPLPPAAPELRN